MTALPTIEKEFEGLSLGDERLERRAVAIATRATAAPAESFPEMLPRAGELEGAYRFFQNEGVSIQRLLKPHQQATFERIRAHRVVRILHDTVALSFGGEREGLGTMGAGGCGFYAQTALAVSGGEERAPLGVVGLLTKVYPTLEEKRLRHEKAVRKFRREKLRRFPTQAVVWKGVDKWSTLPLRLVEPLKGRRAIHVMDREADNNDVMQMLNKRGVRFVIRGGSDRRVRSRKEDGITCVQDKLLEREIVLKRRVRLEARPRPKPGHPLRGERNATLSVRAVRVSLAPANGTHLTLNVVEVFELRPPKGEEPITWVLFTNEPVDSPEEVAAIVDHYRARWRIEEFFKALKTGCSIEKRQLTNFESLQRALVLFLPIAWHLLAVRTLAREENSLLATKVMRPLQLQVLRTLVAELGHQLPENPSLSAALVAVARLGGHLKRNGDPGWITLGRGYDKLRSAEHIWNLAAPLERCDQS
jgi:hypothetical protein